MSLNISKKIKITFSVLAGIVLLGVLGYLYFSGKLFSSADDVAPPPTEQPLIITIVDKFNKPIVGTYVLINEKTSSNRTVFNGYTDNLGRFEIPRVMLSSWEKYVAAIQGSSGPACIVYKDIDYNTQNFKVTLDDQNCPVPPSLEIILRSKTDLSHVNNSITESLIRKCDQSNNCSSGAQFPDRTSYEGSVAYITWTNIEENAEYELVVTFNQGSEENYCSGGNLIKRVRTGTGKTQIVISDCLNSSTPTPTFTATQTQTTSATPPSLSTPSPTRTSSSTSTPSQSQTVTVNTYTPTNGAISRASINTLSSNSLIGGASVEIRDKNNQVVRRYTSSATGSTNMTFTYYQSKAPYRMQITKDGYRTRSATLSLRSSDSTSNEFGHYRINTEKYGYEVSVKDSSNMAVVDATAVFQARSCTLGICIWKNVATRKTDVYGKVVYTADRTYRVKISKQGYQTKYKTLVYPTTMTSGWYKVNVQI